MGEIVELISGKNISVPERAGNAGDRLSDVWSPIQASTSRSPAYAPPCDLALPGVALTYALFIYLKRNHHPTHLYSSCNQPQWAAQLLQSPTTRASACAITARARHTPYRR